MPHSVLRIVSIFLIALLGITGTVNSALTQEATPASDVFPVTPDPSGCTVEPRTIEELEQLAQTAQNATPFAPATGDFTPPTGDPADPDVVNAVANDTIERFACFHAGDYLRAFALQTDAFLVSQFADLPPTPYDLSVFSSGAEPVPAEERLSLVRMHEAVMLPDGRVGAFLDREYPGGLRETQYVIMLEVDGRWRLDDVLFTAPLEEMPDTPQGTPATSGVTVYPPDETIHGATLGEWNARWWQWAVSFPIEIDPGFSGADSSRGDACGYGQSGPVFFLPSASIPIVSCNVPADRAIFVPADAVVCSTVEPPPFFGRNEEELRACAEEWIDGTTSVTVAIDGEHIDLAFEDHRATSPLFTLYLPENNWFEVLAGVAHAVAAGHNVILPPLPEGEYEITTHLVAAGAPGSHVVTYRITVESPTIIEPDASVDGGTPVATPAG